MVGKIHTVKSKVLGRKKREGWLLGGVWGAWGIGYLGTTRGHSVKKHRVCW